MAPAAPVGPVSYAEDTLGVHDVHDDAADALAALTTALDRHVRALHEVRLLQDDLDLRQLEIASEFRGENPDASVAATDRHVAEAKRTDHMIQVLTEQLRDKENERDAAQADIDFNKYLLRVAAARMTELGGLLNFYAANSPKKNSEADDTGETNEDE